MIKVVSGILIHDKKVLIGKRPFSSTMPDCWEFPGGKVKSNESKTKALIREFKEELDLDVDIIKKLCHLKSTYQCTEFTIDFYIIKSVSTDCTLNFHTKIKWVSSNEISNYGFADADMNACKMILEGNYLA